jgi:hypothetical protein
VGGVVDGDVDVDVDVDVDTDDEAEEVCAIVVGVNNLLTTSMLCNDISILTNV